MEPKDEILTRMYMVLTLLFVAPVIVVGQISWILLSEGDDLQVQGREQARSTQTIPAMRGSILDREGRALAINTARYDLALDPTIRGFADKQSVFFDSLSTLTGVSPQTYRTRVEERYSPQYVMLNRDLSERERERIESWDVPGLILTPRFARRYNYGTTTSHVLGHVNADGDGLAGLELEYDEFLTGMPGRRAVKRDRRGRISAAVSGQVVEPKHGENLVLTIDLVRQAALEDELQRGVDEAGAAWGSAVAMDPHTGEILAMANVPTYDPNEPGRYGSAARRNRAITDRFEPGSTFKLVGAAASVGQNVVGIQDTVDTGDGWAVFHGYTMKDVKAYGRISIADVISLSSNVGMAKTASKLDPGTFYQYARNLGFGQPTWIDLPGEVGGVLKKPNTWSQTTLTSMSIGYEVAVTPMQLLTAYAALANGGLLVQPYVVAERQDVTGRTTWTNRPDSIRRALDRKTAETLRPAFQSAVESGTAQAARVRGLPVGGKTGTALKVSDGTYSRSQARASFVGFFPADDPEVVLLVIVGEPETSIYGGAVAAPIFQRIARRWVGTFPDIVKTIIAGRDTAATPAAGDNETIRASQAPTPQAPVAMTSLTSALPDSSTTMPDLEGVSMRRAVHWLQARGVRVVLNGTGRVTRQAPGPGDPLPSQAMLDGSR